MIKLYAKSKSDKQIEIEWVLFISLSIGLIEDFLCNRSGSFNYDNRFRGATDKPAPLLKQDRELAKDGFSVNCARVLVGSGRETFEKGKAALQNWRLGISIIHAEISCDQWSDYVPNHLCRHFGLNWAFVDPKAPIQSGTKFCVCVKEFFPWLMMPLQVVYVTENKNSKKGASFSFGGGTLQGHLLVSLLSFVAIVCFTIYLSTV